MTQAKDIPQSPRLDCDTSALFLDVDGTLLDIAATPQAVQVPAELIQAITALQTRLDGAIAFISGRMLDDLDRLFSPLMLPAVGTHGAQIRLTPGGAVEQAEPIDDEVRGHIDDILRLTPGVTLEDKGYSLALHYRLAPEHGTVLLRALMARRQLLDRFDLQLLKGKCVVEVKPRGFNKGAAMRRMMATAPFKSRVPVFIGDDVTDEDVFRALPEFGGVGFAVGHSIPNASYVFERPQQVRDWLIAQARECGT